MLTRITLGTTTQLCPDTGGVPAEHSLSLLNRTCCDSNVPARFRRRPRKLPFSERREQVGPRDLSHVPFRCLSTFPLPTKGLERGLGGLLCRLPAGGAPHSSAPPGPGSGPGPAGCSDKAIYRSQMDLSRMGASVSQRQGNITAFPWRQEKKFP